MTFEAAFDLVLRLGGTLAAGALALLSAHRRSIQLGDEPTLPQYFVRRSVYRLGIGTWCLLIAVLFYLLVTYWAPLRPLVDALAAPFRENNGSRPVWALDGSLFLPLILAAGALFLLGWEHKFNPLLILRDTIYDASAIPRTAVKVYNVLRVSRLSAIDAQAREQIVGRLLTDSLDVADFDRGSSTLEYRWARSCVLFDKINSYATQDSYARFFAEPSLMWGDICIMFNDASEKMAVWKRGPASSARTIELLQQLDRLNGLLCRFLACLIIVDSPTERELWQKVERLGGSPRQARLKHTYKYLVTYAAALAAGVVVGRELSVFIWNQIVGGEGGLAHFQFDTLRWILWGILIFVVPIALVFAARATSYRIMPEQPERYYGFYVLMSLAGFLFGTAFAGLVLGLDAANGGDFDFLRSFVDSMRWGLLPAMMCGYVAFEMDTFVSDDQPRREMVWRALLRFAAWAALGLVMMLYATDDLRGIDNALRFTAVVTTAFVVGFLGAVTRFKTIPSALQAQALEENDVARKPASSAD